MYLQYMKSSHSIQKSHSAESRPNHCPQKYEQGKYSCLKLPSLGVDRWTVKANLTLGDGDIYNIKNPKKHNTGVSQWKWFGENYMG